MIRVRFAPSPTGSLHVGGARTALFNWLFVQNARRKNEQATFVLRVEDTDKQRSTDEFTRVILDGMAWLGLTYDEGPLFQADGLPRHQADADRLVAEGKAYVEDGAIRFTVTHEDITWDDAVHGPISFHGKDLEDFIILRADRTPVYNFAVVSDDIAMQITHVLRGDDHISNTPKQILLYRAFGATPPVFGHVPMILGTDGKKLSKRHGATAVGEYQKRFLPGSMVNFLALLGWSPGHDRELFYEVSEMVDAFSLDGLQRKPAVFDEKKLEWMNAEHMKHVGPQAVLARLADPELANVHDINRIINAVLPRSRTLEDVSRQARVRAFPDSPLSFDEKALWYISSSKDFKVSLQASCSVIQGIDDKAWTPSEIESQFRRAAESTGRKLGELLQPVRIAVTGSVVSEPVTELLEAVGKERALKRLNALVAGSAGP